jgi:prephenate dehydrogenase
MFEHVSIIGLGLLGGSLARAMKAHGLAGRITGCGRRADRLKYALDNGIADAVDTDPVRASRDADLVVISTPVTNIPEIILSLRGVLKPGTIITDMGSTKTEIVRIAEEFLEDGVQFVGGHPMAGSEDFGVESSIATLFENSLCVLTSSSRTDIHALQRLQNLWETLHCRVMILTPEEHDLLVAAASHLPHIVAVSLARCVEGLSADHEKVLPLLAGGFRDTTRVASGSPEVWRDICIENRHPIGSMLDRFAETFRETASVVVDGDPRALERLFGAAKHFRDDVPARGRGALVSEFEVLVDVADRPGVIGEIASGLGRAGVNIRNINIQHVRELGGGTMLLTLEKEQDMDRAVEVLRTEGFSARPKP